MLRNRMSVLFRQRELHLARPFTADLPAPLYVEPLAPKSTQIQNLFLCGQFFAQFVSLINRWARREIFQLEELPYFNFAVAVRLRGRNLLGPLEGFFA